MRPSRAGRSGSGRMSIGAILPSEMVQLTTENTWPSMALTRPATPLIRAGRVVAAVAVPRKVASRPVTFSRR
ncbi:hypothetical protein HNP84_005137 [Thermocatellispora tengchongensis]|uniref:Uncharacterized protein n=1 Tax=Thermocatellispora tengchongensis TaxID=1073253 RepID=A0A840PBV0_9ACTN|nr:hypothetical protein [Thermocatellispora tengchongensis]